MAWKTEKDGLTVTYTKDNLTVVWDLGKRKYEVWRKDERTEHVDIVEQRHAPHLPVETFLHYVEMTWGNNTKNE